MKLTTRILVTLLALAMLVCTLAACGDGNGNEDPGFVSRPNGEEVTEIPNDQAPDEAEIYRPQKKNYGNYEYVILTSTNGTDSMPYYGITEASSLGDIVPSALNDRAMLMWEEYGAVIVVNEMDNYYDTLSLKGAAGDYVCDVCMIPASQTFKLASQGYFMNFLEMDDYINLDATYWDQRIQDDYRINDMLFTLEGDFTYYDELRTLIVVYNETVYDQYGYKAVYGTPYDLVEKHEWTYATMMQMIKELAADTNDDGEMNEFDTWGMVSELTATYYFFMGSGLKTIDNQSGELDLCINDATAYSRIYDVIEETMTLVTNPDVVMPNRPGAFVDSSDMWTTGSNILKTNRALFRTTTMTDVLNLVDMKSNYGIFPIPAFFEDQTEYYCWVSGNTATPMSMSRHVKDAQRTAEITERLCYHSRYGSNTLYSAFFDRMRYARICRTENDVKMLDVIIDSKTYDIDQATKITEIEPKMYSIGRDGNFTALKSTLDGLVETANAKLDKYLLNMISKNFG